MRILRALLLAFTLCAPAYAADFDICAGTSGDDCASTPDVGGELSFTDVMQMRLDWDSLDAGTGCIMVGLSWIDEDFYEDTFYEGAVSSIHGSGVMATVPTIDSVTGLEGTTITIYGPGLGQDGGGCGEGGLCEQGGGGSEVTIHFDLDTDIANVAHDVVVHLDSVEYHSTPACTDPSPEVDLYLNNTVTYQFTDPDKDGTVQSTDNCINISNTGQSDDDGDGYGDACDGDFNNDGVVGTPDFNVLRQCMGQAVPGSGPSDDSDCGESDMNNDGAVGSPDFNYWRHQFQVGAPGPSGDV